MLDNSGRTSFAVDSHNMDSQIDNQNYSFVDYQIPNLMIAILASSKPLDMILKQDKMKNDYKKSGTYEFMLKG
ncbi:hypothetical protein BpHYR1_038110 [Brachionus plicatilis]|uniref:Uncharacterized protein n=1 Tax=Brachionus plicatilis TaxID=10195 RepID=A0A3M7Q3X9_BRAPC|nr:hypothetical protein BpHYR1_038110 [Brachionus plicatilis]